jgi:hypothetical protein
MCTQSLCSIIEYEFLLLLLLLQTQRDTETHKQTQTKKKKDTSCRESALWAMKTLRISSISESKS